MTNTEIEDIEVALFVEALWRRHGYDFRHYAQASLRRRVLNLPPQFGCTRVVDLLPLLLRDDSLLPHFIASLSVPVSEMFRDPDVFLALRQNVVPVLRSYPHLNIWQVGCATGEEVYSLAILLKEEDLYARSRIYATDINDIALSKAEEGVFPIRHLKNFSENYFKAGGTCSLSDYYHAQYEFAKLDSNLRENIIFAHHNVVSDGVFCEMNLILCRNVLIYFDRTLQDRVFHLFYDSLVRGGFLCLGTREHLDFSTVRNVFRDFDVDKRIFQRLTSGCSA